MVNDVMKDGGLLGGHPLGKFILQGTQFTSHTKEAKHEIGWRSSWQQSVAVIPQDRDEQPQWNQFE